MNGSYLKWASNFNAPLAIRYPRGGDIDVNLKPLSKIEYGNGKRFKRERR
nr:hypothetical protein CPBEC2_00050 [Clostridium perfringens]